MHSVMAKLNLGQDVASKIERKKIQVAILWPNLFPYNKL